MAMGEAAYAAFSSLDPFFAIAMRGLAGLVDGDHYFDTIAPDAVFEFRYRFPGYPTKVVGRDALVALYSGYGAGMILHSADALVVNVSRTPGVVILEYEVRGAAVRTGKPYENRFISVVTIKDRRIAGWRDYMDSLAAMSALS
jgi:ketosteroid isomerase-like protein